MLMYASWFKAEQFKQLCCDAQGMIKDIKWLLLVVGRFFTSSHHSVLLVKCNKCTNTGFLMTG